MLTVKEYAACVNLPVSTVRQLCAEAKLPSVKVGKAYRILKEDADEYFRQLWLERKQKEEEGRRFIQSIPKKQASDADSFLNKIKAMRQEAGE